MLKTGDIQKNIEELNRELKRIQYPNKLPSKILQSGNPEVYLPIIHYTLFKYSLQVAKFLADHNYDLFAKNDYDFISSAFSALIKLFNYKPCLTLDSFFSKGSAENKVILCCDIIQLIQAKHAELSRKAGNKPKQNPTKKPHYAGNAIKPATSSDPVVKERIQEAEPQFPEEEVEEEDRAPSSPKFNSKGELSKEEDEYYQQDEGFSQSNNNLQYTNDQVELFDSSQEFSVYNSNSHNHNSSVYNSKNKREDSNAQSLQVNQSCKSANHNVIDFSALVQVINTLSSSVSQMANKVEKFKVTIEDRLSKIEAEVSLIKNKQSILENKCNNLQNNSMSFNSNNPQKCNSPFKEDYSKQNDQLVSFAANVHSLDLSNQKECDDRTDFIVNKPQYNTQTQYKPKTNILQSNYEDTDRLIENVERKFKETQKLLSEFNS